MNVGLPDNQFISCTKETNRIKPEVAHKVIKGAAKL